MEDIREEHCRGVTKDGNDKKKIHALRLEAYARYN